MRSLEGSGIGGVGKGEGKWRDVGGGKNGPRENLEIKFLNLN